VGPGNSQADGANQGAGQRGMPLGDGGHQAIDPVAGNRRVVHERVEQYGVDIGRHTGVMRGPAFGRVTNIVATRVHLSCR
jgi:hypothetical protein